MSYRKKYRSERKQEFREAKIKRSIISGFFSILLVMAIITMMLGISSADYEDSFFVFLLAGAVGTTIASIGLRIMEGYDEDARI